MNSKRLEWFRGPPLLLILSFLLAGWFFADRVAGLWQHPFRSAVKGWDNTYYYLWLRGPMVRGDLDFQRDLWETETMTSRDKSAAMNQPLTVTGHLPNKYPVGWAISSLPWYALGAGLTRLLNMLGAHLALDGYGTYYQLCLMLGQLFYAGLGLWMAWWLVRRYIPGEAAIYGVLLIWLGSFLFYYQTTNLSMTHNLNFLAQMGAYCCSFQIGARPELRRYWFGLGFFCALALLARYQSAALLIYPLIQAGRVSLKRRSIGNLTLTTLVFMVGILPQLLAWKVVYGSFLVYSYQGEGFDWRNSHVWGVLFSPWHGLFYWHPLLILATMGFLAWCVATPSLEAGCWLLSALLTTAINSAWSCWWFGSAFGLRAFDGCIFFGMLGFAYLLYQTKRWPFLRTALIGLALVLVAWNVQLAWLARKDWLNLEEPVTYQQMFQTVAAFWHQTIIPAAGR